MLLLRKQPMWRPLPTVTEPSSKFPAWVSGGWQAGGGGVAAGCCGGPGLAGNTVAGRQESLYWLLSASPSGWHASSHQGDISLPPTTNRSGEFATWVSSGERREVSPLATSAASGGGELAGSMAGGRETSTPPLHQPKLQICCSGQRQQAGRGLFTSCLSSRGGGGRGSTGSEEALPHPPPP